MVLYLLTMIAWYVFYGLVIITLAIGSPIIGAYFIRMVVQRTNRRDDPRQANDPSHDPSKPAGSKV
jgi:hypothetical protein